MENFVAVEGFGGGSRTSVIIARPLRSVSSNYPWRFWPELPASGWSFLPSLPVFPTASLFLLDFVTVLTLSPGLLSPGCLARASLPGSRFRPPPPASQFLLRLVCGVTIRSVPIRHFIYPKNPPRRGPQSSRLRPRSPRVVGIDVSANSRFL